jgi:hypothetical protein
MREFWELASYIVTVLGLPLAIGIFLWQEKNERANEEEEGYQLLSNAQSHAKTKRAHAGDF